MSTETTVKTATTDQPNSQGDAKDVGGVAGQRLRAFLDHIERLEEEKSELADAIKDVFAEAKSVGFDVPTMRKILRLQKMQPDKRREQDELVKLYKAAIGLA